MTYNEIIQKVGKRIKKHVYYIEDGVRTNVDDESVERIKFDTQTPLIGTATNRCEITLKEKISGNIYVEIEAKYQDSTATKTYGPFNLKEEPTYNADKKTYLHKTYDSMLKSMIDYQAVNINYPCSIYSYFSRIISTLGYTTQIASLPNGNIQMPNDIFVEIGYTYRDVLDDIAFANGVLFYVEGNEFKIADFSQSAITIDDDILKNKNISFGEHYGPINSIVLSRSGESDNVYLQDDESIQENGLCEFKIVDNQLMRENNRSDFLPALLEQLDGIEYDIYDTELVGYGDLQPLQKVNFETNGSNYSSYIFNNEVTFTSGYKQTIYNEMPKETETDYKSASKTDQAINQAYIIARKNEAEIEAVARKVKDISKSISGVGSLTYEDAYPGPLHRLEIAGNVSNIMPKETLYPADNLYIISNILVVDEEEYELGFYYLNYISDEVHDKYVNEDGKQWIERNVGVDNSGNTYALSQTVIEELEDLTINIASDSTIYMKYHSNAIFNSTYLLQNDYTSVFASQAELRSEINETAEGVDIKVSTKVGKEEVISSINLTSESATIDASKINIKGTLQAINNDTTTTINGDKITTGSITAEKVSSEIITTTNFSAQNINANKITGGTINGTNVNMTNINASNITSGRLNITSGSYYLRMGFSEGNNPSVSGLNVGGYGINCSGGIQATSYSIYNSDTGKSVSLQVPRQGGGWYYITFTGGILTAWERN